MDSYTCDRCIAKYLNSIHSKDEDLYKQSIENKITDYYKAGEYLFKNGTPSFGTFCVCSGKIELLYRSEEGFLSKIIKMPGEIIGEDNLEINDFVFDALALEDSEVCFFDKNFFMNELMPQL